jgi:hypothetical protein
LPLEIRAVKSNFLGERGHARPEIRRQVLNRQRIRDREVLLDGELLDQNRTLGEQAKAIERLQPGLAIGDRGGELTEYPDLAASGTMAAVIRSTRISAVMRSNPQRASVWPSIRSSDSIRSGRRL